MIVIKTQTIKCNLFSLLTTKGVLFQYLGNFKFHFGEHRRNKKHCACGFTWKLWVQKVLHLSKQTSFSVNTHKQYALKQPAFNQKMSGWDTGGFPLTAVDHFIINNLKNKALNQSKVCIKGNLY